MVPATEQTTLQEKNEHLNLSLLKLALKNKKLLLCLHSQAHTNIGGFQRIQEQIIQTVDQKIRQKSKHKTSGDGRVKFTGDDMKSIFSSQSNYYTVTNQIMPCECIAIQHIPIKRKSFYFLFRWLPLKTDLCSTKSC